MNGQTIIVASAVLLLAGTGIASADCADDIASLEAQWSGAGPQGAFAQPAQPGNGQTTNFQQSASSDSANGQTPSARRQPIAKDGSLAPLQSASNAQAPDGGAGQGRQQTAASATASGASQQATATAQPQHSAAARTTGLSKDGSTAPLASTPGQPDEQIATSQQAVDSQQAGVDRQQTASTQGAAAGSGDADQRQEALRQAMAARDNGDEAACLAAVQRARGTE
ncbi:hypothetical protein [Mangrovibrevibacter kandeliae]|uniref:hypothetical protein n=1 Tax=Mangrovibrevibacter kandeliae TaxID=2968473 RepID=UPI002118F0E2|nr:hypothetical protein [Aurantimonas sp. CSK15Z-1]MCQ8782725.1 hypothetical protein [Aurantimonas sp. CSK15Z-1]